ncbi:MAG: hypothetical protein HWD61_14920 [Parachlamydiaceae bacterium]|nr:MAG: hypothetical protein HWD61_14920 [Parachlamydiaceae bacterium]
MLYIIQCLKEDRKAYYEKHPNYLDKEVYESQVKEFEKNGINRLADDQRYAFEWTAVRLIGLEQEIQNSQSERDVELIMQKFRRIYADLSNDFMDLTVCTTIDPQSFLFVQTISRFLT